MTHLNFDPLYRHGVGFDRLARMLDSAMTRDTTNHAYPPYNIETIGENNYQITLAVAGFTEAELDITVQENTLLVKGKGQPPAADRKFLHQGIAGRDFAHRFELADHLKVTGASLNNGLLTIDLVREVPEVMKPRHIAIATVQTEALAASKAA